jgi:hypothetical protein
MGDVKRFYLLRHEDINNNSGVGVVSEGIIFGDGTGSFTWLTKHKTVTVFVKVRDVINLHGHGGKTEMVIEGIKRHSKKFEECERLAHDKWLSMKSKRKVKGDDDV